ncbi:MAG: PA2778 family cysteine peptidase [Ectothiorhodospiraceae bacterium]|nr:PA2778 family cysteine peptidase [Ectothiorhodospiraceae bacterium]
MTQEPRRQPLHALLLVVAVSTGCAGGPPLQYRALDSVDANLSIGAELSGVPFHPQEAYHCGPASLAMLLNWQGVPVHPDDLAPQVYLDARQGSLQSEMLAAARRQGLLPYVHEPSFGALLRELDAGHPVLVLKNLAFERYPIWHYAVVIGYDLEHRQVILRSGTTERKLLSFRRFERRWQGGDYWAITLHQPGRFPAGADEQRYLRAAAGLEQAGRRQEAEAAYRAATERWPDGETAWLALGNAWYVQQQYQAAETAYLAALEREPDSAAAHHNLAWARIRQARPDDALPHALRAHRLAAERGDHYRSALQELLRLSEMTESTPGPR